MEPIREYTRGEYIADAIVHAAGISFALIGGPVLIGLVAASGEPLSITAISIYVLTLTAMLSLSAAYNLIHWPAAKEFLRRCDHSTIYLKIAGAYTPFALLKLSGAMGLTLLTAVWIAATIGIALKFLFPRRFELFSLALYMLMGWAAFPFAGDLAASVSAQTMFLILTAGCLYTAGVIFHVWKRLPYQNAIWHIFVLVATATLYAAMAIEFT